MSAAVEIHPSAFVDARAEIGDGTRIGPGVVIEGQVVLGGHCEVHAHAVITGRVICGERNVIGHGAVIGAPPQDLKWNPAIQSGVVIGNRNVFREYVTIHRGAANGSETIVGDDNFLMCGAHLGHNVRLGNRVVLANNCLLAGHVEVGDGAFLGGASVFHQFTRVGRLVITQGMSGCGKDVPPFCLAAGINRVVGLNVVGLRRAGFDAARRAGIQRAFNWVYRDGMNVSQALERRKGVHEWSPEAEEFFEFIEAATRRGICAGPVRGGRRTSERSEAE